MAKMNEPIVLPSKSSGRQVDLTLLRSYLVSAKAPKEVPFQDTLVPIVGLPMKDRPKDLLWGVHGSRAISDASVYFSRAALDEGKLLYELDLSVRIEKLRTATTSVTEETVRSSGLLTVGRLKASYEKEIRDEVLGYLEGRVPAKVQDQARKMVLDDLLMQFPSAVWRYMRERPWLFGFVHPALVRVADATDKRAAVNAKLQLITFRADPSRIEQATVRQMPDIPITI